MKKKQPIVDNEVAQIERIAGLYGRRYSKAYERALDIIYDSYHELRTHGFDRLLAEQKVRLNDNGTANIPMSLDILITSIEKIKEPVVILETEQSFYDSNSMVSLTGLKTQAIDLNFAVPSKKPGLDEIEQNPGKVNRYFAQSDRYRGKQ